MNLTSLLSQDTEAKRLFQSLPKSVQTHLTKVGSNISTLAALREYASNLIAHAPIHYNDLVGVNSGIPIDSTLAAEWTMEHQC